MGSHLWSFQKWCVAEPDSDDHATAVTFIRGCLDRGLTETCEIDDDLVVLVTTLNGTAGDGAYGLAVVNEFIGNCYAELLYDTDILEDQLACLIAACRQNVRLMPRDALLGGAIDPRGCSACGRTYEQLLENGHVASSAHQAKTKAAPRPSRNSRVTVGG